MLHSDVKPANVLITKEKDVRLVNIGVSKVLRTAKNTQAQIGTNRLVRTALAHQTIETHVSLKGRTIALAPRATRCVRHASRFVLPVYDHVPHPHQVAPLGNENLPYNQRDVFALANGTVMVGVPHAFQVLVGARMYDGAFFVPRATVLVRIAQAVYMTLLDRNVGRRDRPRAAVLVQVAQAF